MGQITVIMIIVYFDVRERERGRERGRERERERERESNPR